MKKLTILTGQVTKSFSNSRIIFAFLVTLFVPCFVWGLVYAEWIKTFGGGSSEYACSIQQTSDGGYIVAGGTGSFGAGSDDFFVQKLYSNGNIKWQKAYGGTYGDFAYSWTILQTDDGGYIVGGSTDSFGGSAVQGWILKLNSDGSIDWEKTYETVNNIRIRCIQKTTDGGYIVTGRFAYADANVGFPALKLDGNGNIEWFKTYGKYHGGYSDRIRQTSDGGYIVVGSTDSFGAGSYDAWIVKLYGNGNIEWQNRWETKKAEP